MALTEDRILVSYEINLANSIVSILWHDRILRDGDVISSVNHRGAYELINGDLPEHIKDDLDISLASLSSEALLRFTKENADLRGVVAARDGHIDQLTQDSARMRQQLDGYDEHMEKLNVEHQELFAAYIELKVRVGEAQDLVTVNIAE